MAVNSVIYFFQCAYSNTLFIYYYIRFLPSPRTLSVALEARLSLSLSALLALADPHVKSKCPRYWRTCRGCQTRI